MNLIAIGILLIASILKGITGFGFALVALPVLSIWYSPKELIPFLMINNLIASGIILLQPKEEKLVNESFKSLIFWGSLFTIAGVIILKFLPEKQLSILLGLGFVLMSLLSIVNVDQHFTFKRRFYKFAGAFIGIITGSMSVSGPPLALFINSTHASKQEFREIFAWFSTTTAIVAILGYYYYGLLDHTVIRFTLWCIPLVFLGAFIGKRINHKIPQVLFTRVILVITLISSVIIIVKAIK